MASIFLSIKPVYASWEQVGDGGDWQYRSEETGELEKDKWILDDGKWYYIGSDGLMYHNQWIFGAGGERIAWFDADGVYSVFNNIEKYGPSYTINRYLSASGDVDSSKVKLNMNFLTELSDDEMELLNYICENYKFKEYAEDGQYTQECFVVLGELGKNNDDIDKLLNKINLEVYKETGEKIFYSWLYTYSTQTSIVSDVKIQLNSHTISAITNLRHLSGLLNNTLVRELNIVDGETSQVEAARRIYDWICLNYSYDLEMKDDSLLSCYAYRKGICWDFAILYKKMCNMCGIQCDVEGGTENREKGHVWNKTVIDGVETWTDCTWGVNFRESGNDKWTMFCMQNREDFILCHWDFVIQR